MSDDFSSEKDVKSAIRAFFNQVGGFVFMPPANGFGRAGVSDFIVIRKGHAIAIEAKYGTNKPTKLQLAFGKQWVENNGIFAVVNERNLMDKLLEIKDATDERKPSVWDNDVGISHPEASLVRRVQT